jgi:fermentation-respiration switch protein FrsA (DUF1100 family)
VTKLVLVPLVLAAAALVALVLLARVLEPRLAFYPVRGAGETPATFGVPYRDLVVTTPDGERLHAWVLPREDPLAQVLYFHGNGGNLAGWAPVLAGLHRRGFEVLALDYRGYGLSSGTPSERGLYVDAQAFVRRVAAELRNEDVPLVYWGRSLGCAPAARAARVVPPDGLVLEAGFARGRDVFRGDPVLAFLGLFASYRFDTAALLRGVDRPVLLLHGDRDGVVPLEEGERLFRSIRSPKRFHRIRGGGHNDAEPRDPEAYWGAVEAFVGDLPRGGR